MRMIWGRFLVLLLVLALGACSIPLGRHGSFNVAPTISANGDLGVGLTGGFNVFGLDVGLSATARCVGGFGASPDGEGVCLGVGVSPNSPTSTIIEQAVGGEQPRE